MNMLRNGGPRKRIDLRKAKKPALVISAANDNAESGSKTTLETSSKDKVLKKVFLPKKVSICPNCKVSVNISESGKRLVLQEMCEGEKARGEKAERVGKCRKNLSEAKEQWSWRFT